MTKSIASICIASIISISSVCNAQEEPKNLAKQAIADVRKAGDD